MIHLLVWRNNKAYPGHFSLLMLLTVFSFDSICYPSKCEMMRECQIQNIVWNRPMPVENTRHCDKGVRFPVIALVARVIALVAPKGPTDTPASIFS